MFWTLLHIIDIIAWMVLAWSTSYVAFFVIIHLLHLSSSSNSSTGPSSSPEVTKGPRFLVLIPAYHEENVILHTVDHFLEQTYPQEDYQLTVISDHIGEETNEALRTSSPSLKRVPRLRHCSLPWNRSTNERSTM